MDSKPITYTVKEIADEIGVSLDTVRRYSRRFARHLSDDAAPEPGTMRLFTPADLYVLRIARQQMRSGKTYEDVDLFLGFVEVPKEAQEQPHSPSTDLATTAALQQVTSALLRLTDQQERIAGQITQTQALERRLDTLTESQSRLDQITAQLDQIRQEQSQLRQATARPLYWSIVGAFVAAIIILGAVALALANGWIG